MSELEREAKLVARDGFDPTALVGVFGDGVISPAGEKHLEAVYYDTKDLRLLRGGVSLRFRDGWMVKLAQPTDRPDLMQRLEIPVAGPQGIVPVAALDLVRSSARGADLVPVARLSTDRVTFAVRDAGGAEVAEIVFDRVVADRQDEETVEFDEIEVELVESAPISALAPIVGRLREMGAGPAVLVSKLARALKIEVAPTAVVVPELDDRATAGDVIRAAIAGSVRRFLEHVPAVILDEDNEGVHQARVATRRLRSDLRTFRRYLDRSWADALRVDLRAVTRLLGALRDLDVLKMHLAAVIDEVPEPERRAAEAIFSALEAERQDALRAVVAGFREPEFEVLLDSLVEACDRPELSEAASTPADPIVLKLARKPWRKVQSAVSELPDEPRPEELHRLRILVKRARYAVEAVALIGGAEAEEFAFRLSELQDVLGEHQDAIVAGAWLHRRDPLQASAAGELIELEVARAGRAAEGWRALWNSADITELTAWLSVETGDIRSGVDGYP